MVPILKRYGTSHTRWPNKRMASFLFLSSMIILPSHAIYIYSTNLIKSFVESYSFDALGKLPFIFMLASSTWGATYTCKCSKLPFNNLTMHSQLSVPTTAYRRKDILISWSLWMKCLCTLGRKLMASSSWNVLFLYVAIGYFDI